MNVDRVGALIRLVGQTVTLRRQTAVSPQTFADATAKAQRLDGIAAERLIGMIAQDEEAYAVEPQALAGWPVPPKNGDLLVAGGKSRRVEAVAEKRIGEVVAMYVVKVKG